MSTHTNRWVIAAASASLIVGVALSHLIEPGLKVESLTLAEDTPAIHLAPTSPGPHPVALLAHGASGSKESLFRFGEALAAAGFDSFLIDLPGHGGSPLPFSFHEVGTTPAKVGRALGSVDVYLGHSMGAGAGAVSVRESGFAPRLFIAVGANPGLGEHGPPLLLLAGQFDEFARPSALRTRTDARLVLSPWSDHVLELLDPYLVNTAVEAACKTVGKTPPAAPTFWLCRLAGLVLGMSGALALLFFVPEFPTQFAPLRGFLFPVVVIIALMLTTGTWFRWTPYPHRLPLQLVLMATLWLILLGVRKLKLPRWSVTAAAAGVSLACVILAIWLGAFPFRFLSILAPITTCLLLAGTFLGWLAARRGSSGDGDIAMAIFAGYLIGQWIPKFF